MVEIILEVKILFYFLARSIKRNRIHDITYKKQFSQSLERFSRCLCKLIVFLIKKKKSVFFFQNAAGTDDTLKQSKEYEEAQKIHDELSKAQQEDRIVQA